EAILRSHLEKLSCFVDLGTGLRFCEQDNDRVLAHILQRGNDEEQPETVDCRWIIGAGGAKSVPCKLLDLDFIGETRDDVVFITGGTHFFSQSIDRE
ncbi:hypothetical protein PAXINDRAFT_61984, partial [Paxillus involutus ATCC 200175]